MFPFSDGCRRCPMPRHGHQMRSLVAAIVFFGATMMLSACSNDLQSNFAITESFKAFEEKSSATDVPEYRLGAGDKLRLTVYGEEDLSGDFEISGRGQMSLPLLGQVRAGGLTVPEFEQSLKEQLKVYLRTPRVSLEVLNYRPFYIQGEVKNGGEFPYSNGLSIRDAIAKAGGYTYRASTSYVYVRHANEADEREYSLDDSVRVLPGDNIRIPERFF